MGPGANGKSMAPNDIIVTFVIWLGNACRIRGGGQKNHTIMHFLTAWKAIVHHC